METSGEHGVSAEYVETLRRIDAAQENDVVERALTAARERLSMDAAYITTIDSRHQTIDEVVGDAEALGLVKGAPIPVEQTYCRRMLDGEMPNIVPDTRAEPALGELAATRTIGSYIGVPVTLSDGRVHGSLCCASQNPRAGLGEDELGFMHVLAGIVATRVERVQDDLARRTERVVDPAAATERSSAR